MELNGRRTAAIFAAALLAALATGAARADGLALRPGMGGVPDLGAITCATFNDMYPAGPSGLRQAILYWTEGYVHARTGLTMDQLIARQPGGGREWNFESLTGHIVEFCKARPEAPVPAAVQDLWGRLEPR